MRGFRPPCCSEHTAGGTPRVQLSTVLCRDKPLGPSPLLCPPPTLPFLETVTMLNSNQQA